MKILVIGSGGREHTIIWKLAQSPKVTKLYCAPGNAGIAELAECVPIKAMDIEGMVAFSNENKMDMVMVAPDDPLAAGMVDALEAAGIRTFGPRKNAAIIESSKAFSKDLMKKYKIPTAEYETFDNYDEAVLYLKKISFPTVIKADGLALGKGVIIAQNYEEALAALKDMMLSKVFGAAGNRVVVEEFLTGPEVSILAFTDGKTLKPMVSSQDHKRALDNDMGLNTGGMGTFSPSRIYNDETAAFCMENIFMPTIKAMEQENRTFKGVIYFGLMLTQKGPKVIEYNARFGDPETQVVLPRLETDLVDIFNAIIDEKLDEIDIKWGNNAAACVILASGGYPGKYETGKEITGIAKAQNESNVIVFHAGTAIKEGKLTTAGGRVLGVTFVGDDLEEAILGAYKGVESIYFEGMHFRKDIGRK